MKKRKFTAITIGILALITLAIALILSSSLHRSSHITLPTATSSAEEGSGSAAAGDGDDIRIEVTPKTVQTVISTLKRPAAYVRTLQIRCIWTGGSSTSAVTTVVYHDYTRTDTGESDGSVRHVITNGTTSYIWYNSSATYYSGDSAGISSDQEQHIPTYEDVLNLDADQITAADDRSFSDENCIYVETAENTYGYVQRYWISTSTGLLIGAERLQKGQTVYWMQAQPLSDSTPTTENFTLPDGRILCRVKQ